MERSAKVKFYDGKLRAVLVSNKSASTHESDSALRLSILYFQKMSVSDSAVRVMLVSAESDSEQF